MMNKIDLNNNEIIKTLVKNHFSLSKESLDFFNHELDSRTLHPFYKKILEKSNDLRLVFDLPKNKCEKLDKGWKIFISEFKSFSVLNRITYENFTDNKININKNNIKLRKALVNFYTENNNFDFIISDILYKIYPLSMLSEKKITEELETLIIRHIDSILEEVSKNCLPKSNSIKLIISLNFADWFLCSTAETWRSCLNLESTFHASYWSGLPGLIGDKNRCMIFITDETKKNYQGIIVNKIIARSWGLLDKKEKICLIKPYPLADLFDADMVQEITGFDFQDLLKNPRFESNVNVDLLYFDSKERITNFIFQDIVGFSSSEKGKIISYGRNSYYFYFNDSLIAGEPVLNYEEGLKNLIENNIELKKYIQVDRHCSFCGKPKASNLLFIDEYENEREEHVCSRCKSEHFYRCSSCEDHIIKTNKNIFHLKNKDVHICKKCKELFYDVCIDCGDLVKKTKNKKIIDQYRGISYICDDCRSVRLEKEKLTFHSCIICDCLSHKDVCFKYNIYNKEDMSTGYIVNAEQKADVLEQEKEHYICDLCHSNNTNQFMLF